MYANAVKSKFSMVHTHTHTPHHTTQQLLTPCQALCVQDCFCGEVQMAVVKT